jgi:hypothetical protein
LGVAKGEGGESGLSIMEEIDMSLQEETELVILKLVG